MINTLARNGKTINDVLILKLDGFLGEGTLGFVYEGSYIKIYFKMNCNIIRFVCQGL